MAKDPQETRFQTLSVLVQWIRILEQTKPEGHSKPKEKANWSRMYLHIWPKLTLNQNDYKMVDPVDLKPTLSLMIPPPCGPLRPQTSSRFCTDSGRVFIGFQNLSRSGRMFIGFLSDFYRIFIGFRTESVPIWTDSRNLSRSGRIFIGFLSDSARNRSQFGWIPGICQEVDGSDRFHRFPNPKSFQSLKNVQNASRWWKNLQELHKSTKWEQYRQRCPQTLPQHSSELSLACISSNLKQINNMLPTCETKVPRY